MDPFVKIDSHIPKKFPDYWKTKLDLVNDIIEERRKAGNLDKNGIKTLRKQTMKNMNFFWRRDLESDYFENDTFLVRRQRLKKDETGIEQEIEPTWLSVKRHDREAFHDWRIMQQIKNALCGDEWEGIELYPAESRLVDTSNQYHLFCFNTQFPIWVFNERAVTDFKLGNSKQRAFNE